MRNNREMDGPKYEKKKKKKKEEKNQGKGMRHVGKREEVSSF